MKQSLGPTVKGMRWTTSLLEMVLLYFKHTNFERKTTTLHVTLMIIPIIWQNSYTNIQNHDFIICWATIRINHFI